jgi:hypothetical protein
MTREQIRQAVERAGSKMLPDNHPVYSEGPSITFSSRMQKPQRGGLKIQHSPFDQRVDPNSSDWAVP